VWDRVLIYGTGGLAVAALDSNTHIDRFDNITGAFVTSYFGAYREERIGWTAGGGIEWAFANNWTAKAEFLYLDFGSFDYISPDARAAFASTQQWRTHIDAQEYVARVGLNYLFHLEPTAAPVVARY
jgi:outer membrane immunogenic protein